jgi:uncharacterized membrane protein
MMEENRIIHALPPPEVLAKLQKVDAQVLERCMRLYEEAEAHRRNVELKKITARIARERLGIFSGLLVAMCGVAGTVLIAIIGHPWPGTVFGAANLATLVSVFVYGTQVSRQARALMIAQSREVSKLDEPEKVKKLPAKKR